VGVYSDKYVKTPNIDGLAKKSLVFTRAFSHNPVTLPAHVNILTGTTPRFHGVSDNTGFRLDERFLTTAEHLRGAGYSTGAFIGSFPLDSRFGLGQGFDVYDDNYGTHNAMELFFVERPAEKVIGPALRWLSQPQRQQRKWFAWIHLFDPHQPYLPPQPYKKQYRHDLYSGEVAYMDASLKVLFDFLENRGFMHRTIIVITGDHGEALGEKGEETHSYYAYNNTIHIPLLFYIPGARGAFIHENVCHVDIFPTLCDLLGIEIPAHIQGKSLVPVIEGVKQSPKARDIYFESLTPFLNRGWAPLRGFVRGDLKYIDLPIPEVYNIKEDIQENRNIAHRSNIKQLKRDLTKLKLDLKGKDMMERSKQVDAEVRGKLKSLGYLSGSAPAAPPREFTAAHDLKTLLPLQNRMLAAIGKYQNGKFQEPVAELKQIVEESPGFTLVYRHIATIYQDFGQVPRAIEILEYGLKKNPGHTGLMSKLGIMLAEANRADEAVELLKLCVQKDKFDPENFNFLGVAYYKKGDFVQALENYRKALELDNNYASVFNNIGSLYLRVYLAKRDEGAYRLAMDNFDRAIAIDPRLFAAYNSRGAAYKFKKRVDKAIEDWKKTIEINPNFIDAYFNIGISYLGMGDKVAALKYFRLCKERFSRKLPRQELRRLDRLIAEAGR
jgi:arylsulfatase A-like enzyme/Flp pilus assembly protein TadD